MWEFGSLISKTSNHIGKTVLINNIVPLCIYKKNCSVGVEELFMAPVAVYLKFIWSTYAHTEPSVLIGCLRLPLR